MFDFLDTEHTSDSKKEWKKCIELITQVSNKEDVDKLLNVFKSTLYEWCDIRSTVELFKQILLNSNSSETNAIFEYVKSHRNILSFRDPFLGITRYFVYYHEIHDIGVFIGRCQIFHRAHEETFFEILKSCKRMVYIVGSDFETNSCVFPIKTKCLRLSDYVDYDSTKFQDKKTNGSEETPPTLETKIKSRTKENPFTTSERILMSTGFLNKNMLTKMYYIPMVDLYNSHLWASVITNGLELFMTQNIALFGFNKDGSSYYLRMFPSFISRISLVPYFSEDPLNPLSATMLRKQLFCTGEINDTYISPDVKKITINIWNSFSDDTKEQLKMLYI